MAKVFLKNISITFEYQDVEKQKTKRSVEVEWYDSSSLIFSGYCLLRRAKRHFRIDRVIKDSIVDSNTGEVIGNFGGWYFREHCFNESPSLRHEVSQSGVNTPANKLIINAEKLRNVGISGVRSPTKEQNDNLPSSASDRHLPRGIVEIDSRNKPRSVADQPPLPNRSINPETAALKRFSINKVYVSTILLFVLLGYPTASDYKTQQITLLKSQSIRYTSQLDPSHKKSLQSKKIKGSAKRSSGRL
ncbi:hypothetical protein [Rahnella sp. AA]|uniref:hypothetical protein n=1 Tax=Rahnella sp. AA TaxID=2057180 RepID=UPI0012FEFE37|nr:hypothetical protein [Rahnella sp. AA]